MVPVYAQALVAFALCTTGANAAGSAACQDTATPLACANAYSPAAVSLDPTVRCPAVSLYNTCAHTFIAGCNMNNVVAPIAEARNEAVLNACKVVCKGEKICALSGWWDSSASFSSGMSASDSFKFSVPNSLNTGSSASDPIGSTSSGSAKISGVTASGSSGYYMQIWQWLLVLCCLGACLASMLAMMGKKKPKKKKAAPIVPQTEPAALPELAPLQVLEVPIQNSYSMMAAPQLLAPQVQYAPSYAPQPSMAMYQSQPQYTTAMAAPQYASPPQYATAAPNYASGYAAVPQYASMAGTQQYAGYAAAPQYAFAQQ